MLNAIFCRLNRRRRAAACPWWRWRCVRPTRSTWCSAGASCWRWRPRRRRWRRGTAPQWPSPTSTASTRSNCGSATRPATATTRSTAPTTTDDERFPPLMDSYMVLLTHSHSLLQHTRQNEILIPLWTIIHRYIICTMLVDDCETKWCIPVRFCMLMKKIKNCVILRTHKSQPLVRKLRNSAKLCGRGPPHTPRLYTKCDLKLELCWLII